MLEREWQAEVVRFARRHGWIVAHCQKVRLPSGHHTTPMAIDGKGFPDLTLARNGVVLLVELKSDSGRVSADQRKWQRHLGESHRLWAPRDRAEMRETLGA